jgi:hypothetical protein
MLLPNLNLIRIFMAITISYTAGELQKDLLFFTVSYWLTSPYHSVIQTVANSRAVWFSKSITASFPQQFNSNSHMETTELLNFILYVIHSPVEPLGTSEECCSH